MTSYASVICEAAVGRTTRAYSLILPTRCRKNGSALGRYRINWTLTCLARKSNTCLLINAKTESGSAAWVNPGNRSSSGVPE